MPVQHGGEQQGQHELLDVQVRFVYFFNDTAATEIYTLSLHDALPISWARSRCSCGSRPSSRCRSPRSEEHTSELQSHVDLVCRLLLEKKNQPRGQLVAKHLQKDVIQRQQCT